MAGAVSIHKCMSTETCNSQVLPSMILCSKQAACHSQAQLLSSMPDAGNLPGWWYSVRAPVSWGLADTGHAAIDATQTPGSQATHSVAEDSGHSTVEVLCLKVCPLQPRHFLSSCVSTRCKLQLANPVPDTVRGIFCNPRIEV